MDSYTKEELNRMFRRHSLRLNALEATVLKMAVEIQRLTVKSDTLQYVPDTYIIVEAGRVTAVHSSCDLNVEVIDLDTSEYDRGALVKAMQLPQAA